MIKLQWIASIWCQNDQKSQNYKSNQSPINLHRFDVKTIKNVELRRKTFKPTQNYTSDLISKNLHRFDVWTIKTTQIYESDQIIMHCIDLMSKRSKMLSYVAKHSKQRKTTKRIKLQWIASIWCQKHQTNAKLQKWSYFEEFASIWRLNDQNNAKLQTRSNYDEFASTWHQNYKQCWGTSQNIQNNAKLQKWSYFDEFASIWRQNDQNNAKLRKWSNYNAMHRFDVKTIKTTQNYNTDQITMNCIDLMSKRSKIAKLRKRSNYNALHRFDVKTI